jgi:hypothetical protein
MGRHVHYFTCDRLSYVFVPFAVVDLISFCGGVKNDIWVLHIVCSWAVRASPPPCCSVELMAPNSYSSDIQTSGKQNWSLYINTSSSSATLQGFVLSFFCTDYTFSLCSLGIHLRFLMHISG